jgi:predicted MPP superfamily phosphohydrolase
MLGSAALLVAGARQARAVARPRDEYEVTHPELRIPGLAPEHDGLRVAHLTDVHTGHHTPDDRVLRAVLAINDAAPDLVVLTGDYVTTKRDAVERVSELLGGIRAPVVATLGNHDHWVNAPGISRGLTRAGYTVLRNQHTVLRLRGANFAIVGIDDGHTRHDDPKAALAGLSTASRLVLFHDPATVRKLPPNTGLVGLAGHTHGGQIFVPGVTGFLSGVMGEPYFRGHYDVAGNHLYVNRGLGFSRGGMPPRINSDPEVAFVTLRRG